ncbi:MAG: ABC transporter substrate-binding protein, partial [Rhodospirillales bacterium]|nr:ABC transporter substrate-binding protein [Rhodospirillales bacterium]
MSLRKLLTGVAITVALSLSGTAWAKELKIGLNAEPSSIDPHYHNLSPNNSMSTHIFGSLIEQDEKQRPIPGLAVSWKPINDTTWEFKLRKGVKFHDGSLFTADDVIFTVGRAPNVPNSPSSFGTYLKGKKFVKIDDHTIHAITEKPYPLMPVDISTIFIVSKKAAEKATTADYNSGKAAIGTGPYKFVEWVPNDRLVLVRNESYYGKKPEWEKVIFKPIKTGPARVAALLA